MPKFLYTAVNRDGNSVTEQVEAENLPQARQRLNFQGYTEISFYESELTQDVKNLFVVKDQKAFDRFLKLAVALKHDTRLRKVYRSMLKATWFQWPMIALVGYFYGTVAAAASAAFFLLLIVWISIPSTAYNLLLSASFWGKNNGVRFYAGLLRFVNGIAITKIPSFEVDVHLACAEAREGNLLAGLHRISKYQHDPKVSPRLFKLQMARVYNHAGDFDSVLRLYESVFAEEQYNTEEMLDYAMCLAVRKRDTSRARKFINSLVDTEMSVISRMSVPFIQGVIEVEDGNFERGEFYLREASKQLEPFKHNGHLVGPRNLVKAFLAIALGRRGSYDEASKLYADAKPYLTSVREKEILARCEAVLR